MASLPTSAATSAPTSIMTPSGPTPPDDEPTIRYTRVDELFQVLNRVPGDVLIVTHVRPRNFSTMERERDSRRRRFRFRYYASSQVLVITLPTWVHEQLHAHLYWHFMQKLVRIGVEDSWVSIGSPTYRTPGHPSGDVGESDSSGGPEPERLGPNEWPTLVIEAGDSKSLNLLRQDMRWWFDASNHKVKIVLLAKFDRSRREIRLENWEEEAQVVRPGATTTRSVAANTLAPVLRQSITITQNAASPPSYNVVRGALVLSFRLLFLKDPGPGEGDFAFSIPELRVYAERVWSVV
ncbi:hypothetical protein C8A00DRAFT_14167 [Chaetomidium leptoderma]|uniref:Uncharacterized protein n=1 Tax=Chaetomidium leptoderma TaxID=669021 RepID=A0AAN6VNS0_9PEZI|nr:hypothetical protein C8A00DRAFT_14167 [Chaetomidium leptoderma]